jgi:very-short-patch-repair endonuclease
MSYSRIINEAKQNHGADNNIKYRARELRKNMTPCEKILWNRLRKRGLNGMHFRRQHPFGMYILDFYCFEANLVIEVDGESHLKKKEYDKERTEFIESTGLKEIRFKNEDIENRLDWVISFILKYIQPSYGLSPLGETGKGVNEIQRGNGKGGQ